MYTRPPASLRGKTVVIQTPLRDHPRVRRHCGTIQTVRNQHVAYGITVLGLADCEGRDSRAKDCELLSYAAFAQSRISAMGHPRPTNTSEAGDSPRGHRQPYPGPILSEGRVRPRLRAEWTCDRPLPLSPHPDTRFFGLHPKHKPHVLWRHSKQLTAAIRRQEMARTRSRRQDGDAHKSSHKMMIFSRYRMEHVSLRWFET